jgi:hypothetical protein
MGNIKESLVPYVKQQIRFAKISFDLYGAASPANKKVDDADEDKNADPSSEDNNERKLSQVEMESSRPAVSFFVAIRVP